MVSKVGGRASWGLTRFFWVSAMFTEGVFKNVRSSLVKLSFIPRGFKKELRRAGEKLLSPPLQETALHVATGRAGVFL